MPFVSVVPVSSPRWDFEATWPWRNNQLSPGAVIEAAAVTSPFIVGSSTSTAGRTIRLTTQGGTGVTQNQLFQDGQYAFQLEIGGNVSYMVGWGGLGFVPCMAAPALMAPGMQTNPSMRAGWWGFTFQRAAVSGWTDASGISVVNLLNPDSANNWPGSNAPAAGLPNQGAFGVFGDGAGGLVATCYDDATPGPANVLTSAPLPGSLANAGKWETVEFFVTGASPSRRATVDFYYQGVAVPGMTGLLFTNAAGGASWNATVQFMSFCMKVGVGGGATPSRMRLASWFFRAGRYTRDGAELRD